jgi:hypothetical protein
LPSSVAISKDQPHLLGLPVLMAKEPPLLRVPVRTAEEQGM